MSILKSIFKWEASVIASATTDKNIIELQTKRIRLIYESLIKQGFKDDQAIRIVSGIGVQNTGF